jgi:endothelin-converting enzyme
MFKDPIKNTSVAEIAAAAPALSLDKLVSGLSPAGHVPTEILLEEPSLWPNISQMITRQPKAAVQGYMIWKVINSVKLLIESPELWEALGAESPAGSTSRWELCVEMSTALVGHMADHYYVSATYPEPVLQAADKLTTNIRTQFKKRIGDLDWMSHTAKQRATSKVDNMRQNIGYQTSNPDVRSMQSLATYYDTLNFTSDYFSNVLSAQGHMATKAYAELARPADRSLFVGGSISRANAFYNPSTNSMFIPAGISQLPIFHHDLPDYALYGGLGVVIGHELTHGFDDGGSMYDEHAELRTWWDNSTVANFANRTQCFVDQYSKYEVDMPGGGKANVDGDLTLGENLSDAGGMRTAYDAWVAERNTMPGTWDQNLPGLDKFTHEQLFFVFFGNMWCGKTTPAMAAMLLQMDNHAPDLQRILGGTANSRAFREAFKCKVKEPTCELF